MEPHRLNLTVDAAGADCFGRLKPSRLLYFAQIAGESHCRLLGLDWEALSRRHLFWAVIRHYVRVERLPEIGEALTLETWPGITGRVAYPRSTACYDEAGDLCFRVMSQWVLMDMDTRTMLLPGKSGVEVPGLVRGIELPAPGGLPPVKNGESTLRTVGYSDLDRNRHMNNCRYLDWTDDLLPSAFHRDHPAAEFTVCYHAEAREGDRVRLDYTLEGTTLRADGTREDGHRIFSVKAEHSN